MLWNEYKQRRNRSHHHLPYYHNLHLASFYDPSWPSIFHLPCSHILFKPILRALFLSELFSDKVIIAKTFVVMTD